MILFFFVYIFWKYICSVSSLQARERTPPKSCFLSGLLGLMLPVDSRENKFLSLAKRSTKLLYFLREGGEIEQWKAKSSDLSTRLWSWILMLDHLNLHAESTEEVRQGISFYGAWCWMAMPVLAWHPHILLSNCISLKMGRVVETVGSVQPCSKG